VSEWDYETLAMPTTLPVTLAEAKAHLRVTHDEEDLLIEELIAAATERFERTTGLRLGETSLVLILDRFPNGADPIRVPFRPLRSVEEIRYVDTAGEWQTLDEAAYMVTTSRQPGVIRPTYAKIWPQIRSQPEAVKIELTAGYEDVPSLARCAILLMIGGWYEHRSEYEDRQTYPLPVGVERIMRLYDPGDELLEYGSLLYGD
jgi:uncharacterized phiE125 gp8 family phage protein